MDLRTKRKNQTPVIPHDGPIPLVPDGLVDFSGAGSQSGAADTMTAEAGAYDHFVNDAGAGDAHETWDDDRSGPGAGPLSLADLSGLDDPHHCGDEAPIPARDEDQIRPANPAPRRNGSPAAVLPKSPAQPAAVPVFATPPVPIPEELTRLTGTTVGRYLAGPVLGVGHSGVVYQAQDTKENRTVALKVLRPEFPKTNEELQHFLQVARAAMSVRHPHLVTVLNVGRTGQYTWLALDLVEGESLAQVLQRPANSAGPAAWHLAFRVAVHVGRALHCAAHHKFVHRGVTPRNVLVRTTDQVVKLADLPLARALTGSAVRQITQRSALETDLAYLAPEQTRPGEKLDCRTDLYSLGAVVYAALTGRPPFSGKTSADTVRMIRSAEPVIPGRLDPSTPDKLVDVILKLLAKKPEDRYQTPAELLKDLAEIAADPA